MLGPLQPNGSSTEHGQKLHRIIFWGYLSFLTSLVPLIRERQAVKSKKPRHSASEQPDEPHVVGYVSVRAGGGQNDGSMKRARPRLFERVEKKTMKRGT